MFHSKRFSGWQHATLPRPIGTSPANRTLARKQCQRGGTPVGARPTVACVKTVPNLLMPTKPDHLGQRDKPSDVHRQSIEMAAKALELDARNPHALWFQAYAYAMQYLYRWGPLPDEALDRAWSAAERLFAACCMGSCILFSALRWRVPSFSTSSLGSYVARQG